MGRKAQNLKTGLIVYNLAILGMFLVFILTIESNSEIILTGFVLFFGNLVLPFLGFLREEIWGKYGEPYEEQMVSPLLKGLKNFKKSNKIEKWYALSYLSWSIAALIVIYVGWVLR